MPAGGKRDGAGRKPNPEKKQMICVYVSPQAKRDYENLKENGVTMEDIINHYTGRDKPEE